MATRVNKAATAVNNKGGTRKRRNTLVTEYNSHLALDSPKNQKAFKRNRLETVARHHNATTTEETEPQALGVPEGLGYTPPRPRARSEQATPTFKEHRSSHFKVTTTVANSRGEILTPFTSEGEGISPYLNWSGVPVQSEEFVLICEDLDTGALEPPVHWLVYRIMPSVRELPEGNFSGNPQIASVVGAPLQGKNWAGKLGYLPPSLTRFDSWHHYRFRLYALEAPLKDLYPGMNKAELFKVMESHILEEAELVCRYRRSDFRVT